LTVGAEVHQRAIARAVTGIEDDAVFVFETVPPHSIDDRETQKRGLLLVTLATVTARVRVVARLDEHFGDAALEEAVALYEQKPAFGLASRGIDLLPQAGDHRLLCRSALDRQERKPSGCKERLHRSHYTNRRLVQRTVSPVAFQCGDFQEIHDVRARVRN